MQSGFQFSCTYYEAWEYQFVPLEMNQSGTRISSVVWSILMAFENGLELAAQLREEGPNTRQLSLCSACGGIERICCQPVVGWQHRLKWSRDAIDTLEWILDDAKANGDVDQRTLLLFLQLSSAGIKRIWGNNTDLINRFWEGDESLEALLTEVAFDFNTTIMRLTSLTFGGDSFARENKKRGCRLELLYAAACAAEHTGRTLLSLGDGPNLDLGPSTSRQTTIKVSPVNDQRDHGRENRNPRHQKERFPKHADSKIDHHKKPPVRNGPESDPKKRAANSPRAPQATTEIPELPCISPRRHSTRRTESTERDDKTCRRDDIAELPGEHPNTVPSELTSAGLEPVVSPPTALHSPSIEQSQAHSALQTQEKNVPHRSRPPSYRSVASDNMPLGEIPLHKLAKPVNPIRREPRQRSKRAGKPAFWAKFMGKARGH